MTFDEWVEEREHEFQNIQAYTEYGADVSDLMEEAWRAGQSAAFQDVALYAMYKNKEL